MAKGLAVISGSSNVVHKFTEDGTAYISGSLTVTGSSYLQEVSGTNVYFDFLTVNGGASIKSNTGNIELEDNLGNVIMRISGSGGQAAPEFASYGDYLFAIGSGIDDVNTGFGFYYNKQTDQGYNNVPQIYGEVINIVSYETSSFEGASLNLYSSGSTTAGLAGLSGYNVPSSSLVLFSSIPETCLTIWNGNGTVSNHAAIALEVPGTTHWVAINGKIRNSGTQHDGDVWIDNDLRAPSILNRSGNVTISTVTSGDVLLLPSGNVGVNTSSPNHTLTVSGSFSVTGSSYLQEVSGTTAQFTSYTGNGANITNLTASNIDNFTADVRAQFSAGTNITIVDGEISAASIAASEPEYSIQFNSGSAFSGSTKLLYQYDNDILSLSGTFDITGSIVPEGDGIWSVGSETNRLSDLHAVQVTAGAYFETGLQTTGIGKNPTGTVVCWHNGKLTPCSTEMDKLVMGVILEGKDEPIIMGAEYILVTGEVEEGDFLVTSGKKGHAKSIKMMNFSLYTMMGCIIGQALESSKGSSNLIKCMIQKR